MIVSTSTHTFDGAVAGARTRSGGFFARLLQKMIDGQERKARGMVRQYLAGMSDETLRELGYGAVEIKLIRKHAGEYGPAWV